MNMKSDRRCTPVNPQKSLLDFVDTGCRNQVLERKQVSFLESAREQNRKARTIVDVPRPFMKWAGGKRQLLSQFDAYIPKEYNKYLEPFIGGGALFFYLLPGKAILFDINPDLVNIYNMIKNNVYELIESLKQHVNDEVYYYKIRNMDKTPEEFSKCSEIEKASRNIYMNRTCFNGLYRVNSKGEFNVPFGKYKNPNYIDEKNLLAVNKALQNVEIYHECFEHCLEFAGEGDFVYFDPPYVPISETASFTSYTKDKFGPDEQRRLHSVFQKLDERGCKLMLSNSHCDFILDLFKDYTIETVMAARAINSDATKRGKVKEVLILNNHE